jgi:hypothetical protein
MPFILFLLLMGTSFAQLPEGFAPPRELLSGPLAEGTLSGDTIGQNNLSYAHYEAERIFQQAPVRVRSLVASQAFNILRRDAQKIATKRELQGRLTIGRNLVVRGLLLVEDLGKETNLREPNGQEVGAAILVETFKLAVEYKDYDSDLFLFGVGPEFQGSSRQKVYPYAALAQQLARRMYGVIPRAINPASRLRLARRLVELLVWDLSRDPIGPSWATQISAAVQLLRDVDAVPSDNAQDNEAQLARVEALQILPIHRMQEVISPFANDEYSQLKGRVWAHFQNNFAEASRCGFVTCATTNGAGAFASIFGANDGEVQENLIEMCLSGRATNVTSASFESGAGGVANRASRLSPGAVCRGALICNRLQDAPAVPCTIQQRSTIYYEGEQNRREFRMPWWPSPY